MPVMGIAKRAAGLVGVLAVALGAAMHARPAEAAIVERVVAIVGERPILLSELRHRARPFLYRIIVTTPNAAQQAAAETEMFRELLNRMIDDRLEEQAADKAHLTVTSEEVDQALRNIAQSAHLPVADLLGEAKRQGLTEQDYRDEIRRQVLEGKLVQLRVRGRVRVTDQDSRTAYAHWLKEMGEQTQAELRIIALRLTPGMTDQQVSTRLALGESIAQRARSGDDFCKLVTDYSDDAQTKPTCGSRGPQPMSALVPALQDEVRTMKDGETSRPIRYGNEAILIVQVVSHGKVPGYEEVRNEMDQRAFGEAMERQRKLWLSELRRGVYVDVRL
jgi:peptidyl-prolyl cis-trans isomerase SurA